MKTPIFDFVQNYLKESPLRLHMPGHKGLGSLGIEQLDITEIEGADVLYHENGILKESQENASLLFGSQKTLYSTEGATLCIRAMLAMVRYYAEESGKKTTVCACRNAHKAFVTGCALMDLDPIWIPSTSSLLSAKLTADDLLDFLNSQESIPTALYLTSPDYLGNIPDIKAIAGICHEKGILLLVDNAHGAYLHFLPDLCHPLDLGADLVCDSAHKTLPVLTGGAYLHLSKSAPKILTEYAASAMAMFSSTSPSYLILQSLDLCNAYLNNQYSKKLYEFCSAVVDFKKELKKHGFFLIGDEPLKITILTKPYGYTGEDFAELLKRSHIYVEFSDPDYVVFMLTPEQGNNVLKHIADILKKIPKSDPILIFPPKIPAYTKILPPREALLSAAVSLPLKECEGKILSQPCVTCPPAIPIAICGEKITKEHLILFEYYGINQLTVKK